MFGSKGDLHAERDQLPETLTGTLPTQLRASLEHGLKLKYVGNNFLKQQATIYTTSKILHSQLDHRYAQDQKGESHGKNSKRHIDGLAKNVARYVTSNKPEKPLMVE